MTFKEKFTDQESREQEAPEAPPAPPLMSLEAALAEIRTVIRAFTVTPQVVNVAVVKYADPAGKEVILAVSLIRTEKPPVIDVVSGLGEEYSEAAERYRIFAGAATEKEGIELLMARMAEQAEQAKKVAGEQGEAPESSVEGTTEEGEPEGKSVIIG